jgi:hypothetical protein
LTQELELLANNLEGILNVGKVDCSNEEDTAIRFDI